MQIDVLSQNTLKLTLSETDMRELDIKYESLSPKNPETKRMLATVLRGVRRENKPEFAFSGEKLFVEAFPRSDGGCLLYISCLEDERRSKEERSTSGERRPRNEKAKVKTIKDERRLRDDFPTREFPFRQKAGAAADNRADRQQAGNDARFNLYVCESENLEDLGAALGVLLRMKQNGELYFESTLLSDGMASVAPGKFRIEVVGNSYYIANVLCEYGVLLPADTPRGNFTRVILTENAAERISELQLF